MLRGTLIWIKQSQIKCEQQWRYTSYHMHNKEPQMYLNKS
jgi:hypothetical protein